MTNEQLLARIAELESKVAHQDRKIAGLNSTIKDLHYDLNNSERNLMELSVEHANLRKAVGLPPREVDYIEV